LFWLCIDKRTAQAKAIFLKVLCNRKLNTEILRDAQDEGKKI